jgi:hypothetical protein
LASHFSNILLANWSIHKRYTNRARTGHWHYNVSGMPDDKRSNIFPIRMTARERKALKELAALHHRSEADTVRIAIKQLIARSKKKEEPET